MTTRPSLRIAIIVQSNDKIVGFLQLAHLKMCYVRKYAFSGKSNGSTGNLNVHLKAVHPDKVVNSPDQAENIVLLSLKNISLK